jgi:predicted transcriptional regulator
MQGKVKTSKQLERHFKGIANHRRIDILYLLNKSENLSLENVSACLGCNIKTISQHTLRLVNAGLIEKKYFGREVRHKLSPYGKKMIKLMETFSHS